MCDCGSWNSGCRGTRLLALGSQPTRQSVAGDACQHTSILALCTAITARVDAQTRNTDQCPMPSGLPRVPNDRHATCCTSAVHRGRAGATARLPNASQAVCCTAMPLCTRVLCRGTIDGCTRGVIPGGWKPCLTGTLVAENGMIRELRLT